MYSISTVEYSKPTTFKVFSFLEYKRLPAKIYSDLRLVKLVIWRITTLRINITYSRTYTELQHTESLVVTNRFSCTFFSHKVRFYKH